MNFIHFKLYCTYCIYVQKSICWLYERWLCSAPVTVVFVNMSNSRNQSTAVSWQHVIHLHSTPCPRDNVRRVFSFVLCSRSTMVPTRWVQAWVICSTYANWWRRSGSCRKPTSSCRGRSAACRRAAGWPGPKRCLTLFFLHSGCFDPNSVVL